MTDVKPHRPSRGARALSREFALLGVYEWLVSGADAVTIERTLLSVLSDDGEPIAGAAIDAADFERSDKKHFSELLAGVIEHAEDLQAIFSKHVDRDISRLSLVERSVLLLGTYELKFHIEIPYRVVINEAVELAKLFGGSDGFRYVNGVLDKVAADVRATEVGAKK